MKSLVHVKALLPWLTAWLVASVVWCVCVQAMSYGYTFIRYRFRNVKLPALSNLAESISRGAEGYVAGVVLLGLVTWICWRIRAAGYGVRPPDVVLGVVVVAGVIILMAATVVLAAFSPM
jgi:hypothetical protein